MDYELFILMQNVHMKWLIFIQNTFLTLLLHIIFIIFTYGDYFFLFMQSYRSPVAPVTNLWRR